MQKKFFEENVIKTLSNVFYWMDEIEGDIKNGVLVLSPSCFITTWMHDLAMEVATHPEVELNWPEIYEKARARAKEMREEDDAKNNG